VYSRFLAARLPIAGSSVVCFSSLVSLTLEGRPSDMVMSEVVVVERRDTIRANER
jgi:hypothetical protein